MNQLTVTDEGKALLAQYHDGKRTITLSHLTFSGGGKTISRPIETVHAEGNQVVVSTSVSDTGLGRGFVADTAGLWVKSGNGTITLAQGAVSTWYIPGEAMSRDTAKVEVAVAIDGVAIVNITEVSVPGTVTKEDFNSTVTDLRKRVNNAQTKVQYDLTLVPNHQFRPSGSTETNLTPAARIYSTKGAMLSEVKGMAAGTYALQTLLNNLVKLSHTHKTTKVINVGTGAKNCNGVTNHNINCPTTFPTNNCSECRECGQCGQCGQCYDCKDHCLTAWLNMKQCTQRYGYNMRECREWHWNINHTYDAFASECVTAREEYAYEYTQGNWTRECKQCRECRAEQDTGHGCRYFMCAVT